ncbi:MAG TPA: DoxX family protein [Geminicoccus sp.]|uniref:DoxX family protein n=1 Tax=Geminicoccus sp. TaxID=2024832 RepID=UPI002E30CF85|nr:DoxX family protein [Geminicoccus sp.]HEX2525696.1 DoxX family protein [Geminicoccus sp.]
MADVLTNPAALLFARLMLILPYWVGGLSKLFDLSGAMGAAVRSDLNPAWAFVSLTILAEIGGSLLVIVDRWTWLGAGILGVLTILDTFVVHRFWGADGSLRVEQLRNFLEHIALAAAFLLVAAVRLAHPRDERP